MQRHRRAERFEELVAWQRAREFVREVYAISSREPFGRDFGLRDQIRRASVSIMSNLAEGFERAGSQEFARFVGIAKASCGEVRSQLYIALDVGYLDDVAFERLRQEAEELSRMMGGLRTALLKATT